MSEPLLPKKATKHQFTNEPIRLKPTGTYPLWITYDALIILETFAPTAKQATDFLIAIAEPLSRPMLMHEYRITAYSLYAAVSVGLTTEDILGTLDRFSKNYVPESVYRFVRECTASYGKVRVVMRESRYFIEAVDYETLRVLLKDSIVGGSVCMKREREGVERDGSVGKEREGVGMGVSVGAGGTTGGAIGSATGGTIGGTTGSAVAGKDSTHAKGAHAQGVHTHSTITLPHAHSTPIPSPVPSPIPSTPAHVEVPPQHIETIKKRCIAIDYPLIEEYDFRNDTALPDLPMDLRPSASIRSYQEICLNKMFGNGRARSGIIVLPCGSGKTLVGITALCTIKKPCLVLCTSAVSVEQWRQQILAFTNLPAESIARFTSERKERYTAPGVVITTYTMLAYSGKRSFEAQRAMEVIQRTEWGILVLDEVHVVPALMFRRVVSLVSHHCKLGLTATLVREDDKIEDLNFLIGPKLYEADWQDLSAQGHIAAVECVEVWCDMTAEFYREYLLQSARRRRVIAVMNPTKMQAVEHLIRRHEARGDKIIVFSDNVCALKAYALKLGKPYIYGPTGQAERMRILKQFQTNPSINTIFLSKVGDTSIDLPEATCLIQISSHYGSRRQEAQRLGRILRAKKRNDPGFKVFFYSLVSTDTDEMFYSTRRQQFLVDQGYTFRVVTQLKMEDGERVYRRRGEQKELLASILLASEVELASEESEDVDRCVRSVSGNEGVAYVEKQRHLLFRKRKK